jgi:hypothetical protein
MKVVKWIIVTLLILFVIAQFIRPERTNLPVDPTHTVQAVLHVPPPVDSILRRSCYDCHSNTTTWPWYSNVAPVSWWLAGHVKDGRRNMNFTEWSTYNSRKASHKLDGICEQVKKGEMPLSSYLILHPSAKLSDADRATLCAWADSASESLPPMPAGSDTTAPRRGE